MLLIRPVLSTHLAKVFRFYKSLSLLNDHLLFALLTQSFIACQASRTIYFQKIRPVSVKKVSSAPKKTILTKLKKYIQCSFCLSNILYSKRTGSDPDVLGALLAVVSDAPLRTGESERTHVIYSSFRPFLFLSTESIH